MDNISQFSIRALALDSTLRQARFVSDAGNFFYAGVDGGGSLSRAVVADKHGKILGQAKAGPSFPAAVGYVVSFANIIRVIKRATIDAGLDPVAICFKRICVGTAGIDTNFDHKRLKTLFCKYRGLNERSLKIRDEIVIQDSLLSWFSAFGGKAGIIVNGGTGDLVYGYNEGKDACSNMKGLWTDWTKVIRLGGRMIGFHSARKVKELIRSGEQSLLVDIWRHAFETDKIFNNVGDETSFSEMLDLIEKSGNFDRIVPINVVASTARLTIEAAKGGDKNANEIIRSAIKNSALYVVKIAEKIGLHKKRFKVAHVGSIIRNPFIMKKFRQTLGRLEPYAILQRPEMEPQVGAIEIARKNIRFY